MASWAPWALWAVVSLFGGGFSNAFPGEAPAGGAKTEAQKPKVDPGGPPAERANPRATMKTFLEAIVAAKGGEAGKLKDAVACLDLSRIDPVDRAVIGPRRARMLLDVLDKTWKVDYREIPEKAARDQWRKALLAGGKTYGELVLARQPGGQWLFEAAFIGKLPEIYNALEAKSYLAGFTGAAAHDPALQLRKALPAALKGKLFLLEHWQWLGLLLLVLGGVLLDKIVSAVFLSIADRLLRHLKAGLDKKVLQKGMRPLGIVGMAALWWSGLYWLLLPEKVNVFLAKIAVFFMAYALVWAAYRIVEVFCAYLAQLAQKTETKMDDLLVPLLRKTLKVFVVLFGIVFVAGNLGIDITSMLLGLGIGGVAFAFAAKDTVENLFGSITVLLDRPFQIGDWVVVGDLEGTVEEVGFRSTRIRTFYNSLVTVPNSRFVHSNVDNYGARTKRRIKCTISVTYATPPQKIEAFCQGIRELILKHPYTCKNYFHVYFNQFAASSLDILLYAFVQTPDWATELRERERLYLDILRLGQRLGVEFAFPTQTLHLETVAQPAPLPTVAVHEVDRVTEVEQAKRLGAREAAELAAKQFGADGAKPEPVQFTYHPRRSGDPSDTGSEGGDGDEGGDG